MNKKGQVETFVGIGILVVVLITGAVGSLNVASENRYVLDKSTNPPTIYDLTKCSISELNENKYVYITDINKFLEQTPNSVWATCSEQP